MIEPPYPADTLAKGWRFELDLDKVVRSDTWLRARTGALRGALLLLWAQAWQQTPCGTLPDDDELVALLIDMPIATFARHRSVLMRGWVAADDGRLYHETITSRVLAMLDKRASDAKRSADRRGRLAEAKASHEDITDASRVTHSGVGHEFDTKHYALSKEKPPLPPEGAERSGSVHRFPPGFEAFWEAYPRKVGKDAAAKAFAKRKPGPELLATMLAAIESQGLRELLRRDGGRFVPHPTTWLNEGRWQDETPAPKADELPDFLRERGMGAAP